MFQSIKRFAGAGLIVAMLGAFAPQAFAQATYYTNSDNENNANTHVADNDMDVSLGNASGIHPIEFNINVATLPQSSAVLSMRALDVDEEQGEVDLVYINGHLLGKLTGANNVWSVTAFNVNPAWLVAGQNLVRINVDTSGDSTAWVTTIDWAQLLIDGGGATDGDTQGVRITGTSVEREQRHHQHLDLGALDHGRQLPPADQPHRPERQRGDGALPGLRGGRGRRCDAPANPIYPLSSVSGTYTVQAQLFWLDPAQSNFPVQQDIAIASSRTPRARARATSVTTATATGCWTTRKRRWAPTSERCGHGRRRRRRRRRSRPEREYAVDTDGDGVINALESSIVDTDGDGVMNQLDPANTNPCVPNANAAACLADRQRRRRPDQRAGRYARHGPQQRGHATATAPTTAPKSAAT